MQNGRALRICIIIGKGMAANRESSGVICVPSASPTRARIPVRDGIAVSAISAAGTSQLALVEAGVRLLVGTEALV
jgi:hypothetical protein